MMYYFNFENIILHDISNVCAESIEKLNVMETEFELEELVKL